MAADNLLTTTQNFLNPNFVNQFSKSLGQPAEKIQIGLRSVIPAFLLGLVKKGSSREGAEKLVSLAHQDGIEESKTPLNLSDPTYLQKGEDAIREIFGNKLVSTTDALGSSTGMNSNAISKIMTMIAPLVMGAIGKKVKTENLTPTELMNYLNQQKGILAGFSSESFKGTATNVAANVKAPIAFPARRKKTIPWPLLATLVLAVLVSLWWFLNRQIGTIPSPTATISESISTPATDLTPSLTPAAANLGELDSFLRAGNTTELPKRFSFINLTFTTGTAALIEGAENELDQIATTLKAHPNVTARIEGFTDNTGDIGRNIELSNERAIAVKNELISRGIDEGRIETVGRGQDSPIADNSTPDGRAQNRRIEFVVTGF